MKSDGHSWLPKSDMGAPGECPGHLGKGSVLPGVALNIKIRLPWRGCVWYEKQSQVHILGQTERKEV